MRALDKIKTSLVHLCPNTTLSRTVIAVALGFVGSLCLATLIFTTYKSAFTVSVPFLVDNDHHLPLKASIVEDLGFVTDRVLNDGGVYHDGGGGASQNGYHVMIFADSATNSSGFNFVHNSVAYFGYRDPTDPLNLYQFGMRESKGKSIFSGIVPVGPEGNETEVGPIFAIWMLSGMTPMPDGQTILGVFPCLNEGNSTDFYSTMVQMNVTDPSTVPSGGNPPFKRLGNGRLFYANEVYYGTFALEARPDGYLYLYGSDVTGIKLARTPITQSGIADRNQYTYFNSITKTWQKDPLTKNNQTGNIITWSRDGPKGNGTRVGPNVGDVYYDNYHKTTVMLWNDAGIDATFWFSYAKTSSAEGLWSEPVAIWTPPIPPQCASFPELNFNYQGHSHPGWDPTGKTLLVSIKFSEDNLPFLLFLELYFRCTHKTCGIHFRNIQKRCADSKILIIRLVMLAALILLAWPESLGYK